MFKKNKVQLWKKNSKCKNLLSSVQINMSLGTKNYYKYQACFKIFTADGTE